MNMNDTLPDDQVDGESDYENEDDEMSFSLADIAGLDAAEIAEVRFEQLPAGLYIFRGEEVGFQDTTNAQDERRIVLTVKLSVVEVKSVTERGYKREDWDELLGKKHTEKFYCVPSKIQEGLGLIRAFVGDIGLPNEGPFGGVEGEEPGIVDGIVDHEFPGRIVKQARKGDPTTKDSRLRIDQKRK